MKARAVTVLIGFYKIRKHSYNLDSKLVGIWGLSC